MSQAMSQVSKELAFPVRGRVLALFGQGESLSLATVHPEQRPTPLYRIDLGRGELSRLELPVALRAITAAAPVSGDEEPTTMYASGQDRRLYRITRTGTERLGEFDADVIALHVLGDELFALSANALRLIDAASGAEQARIVLERASAFAVSSDGLWLAIGFEDGRIQAFSRESGAGFEPGESLAVHQEAVSQMLFDRNEPLLLSAAADRKLMLTQLRGLPETAERSGKGHDGPVLCLIPAPGEGAFSGGQDATVRLWAGGNNRKPPSSTACEGPIIALSCWSSGEGARALTRLAAADAKGRILVMPLDEKRKPQSPSHRIGSFEAWIERELASPDSRVRQAALDELARGEDRDSLRRLSDQALRDSEPRLRARAAELLAASSHAETDEQLARLLAGQDPDVALTAFNHLLTRARLPALDVIGRVIDAEQPALGLAAIARLEALAAAELGSPAHQALDALAEVLETELPEWRRAAFAALARIYARDPMQAISLGLSVGEPDVSVLALRHGYASDLLGSSEFLRLMRRHLNDQALEVRYMAFTLSLLTRPKLATVLRALDEDLERRLADLEGRPEASKAAEAETPAKAETSAKSKKPKARAGALSEAQAHAAAAALSEAERAPLVEAMATPALDICLAGAKALAAIQDPRAFGVLLQLSRESKPETRAEVCKAFADLGDANAISRLRLLLHDDQLNVADAAFTALGRLLADDAAALADAGLNAPNAKIRLRAIAVIARLLKPQPDKGAALLARGLNDRDESVRREAFKTLLNAKLHASRAETLRFALASAQSDIRREVLLELEAEKKQAWALELLTLLIDDNDAELRAQAFALLRQQQRETGVLYARALSSRHEDLRSQALTLLLDPKTGPRLPHEDLLALVAGRLDDRSLAVRAQALAGLIQHDDLPRLRQALQHAEPDVRVGAAAALAAYGLPEALDPLLAVLNSEAPEKGEREWAETVKTAIKGLAALGDEAAWPGLRVKLLETKSDTKANSQGDFKGGFAKAAAAALRFVVRPAHAAELGLLHAQPDKALRRQIALALAAIGEAGASSDVFAEADAQTLAAALMLRAQAPDRLYSLLDLRDGKLRARALLLMLLCELGERKPRPEGCLAGLASGYGEIRLRAANALESYADPAGLAQVIATQLGSLSGADSDVIVLPEAAIQDLAALLNHGPGPVRLALCEGLLAVLEPGSDTATVRIARLKRWWQRSETRYAAELTTARSAYERAAAALDPAVLTPALLPLAIGTYVGMLRQQGAGNPADRQLALRRLAGIAARIPAQAEAIATCLKVALSDRWVMVREEAFERLRPLIPLSELAAEAVASEQGDIVAKALNLLTDPARGASADELAATERLLRDLQQSFSNGLENVAHQILIRRQGALAAQSAALTARDESLRQQAAFALYSLSEKEPAAREVLAQALGSDYADVRQQAASHLARLKDRRALPLLSELIRSREYYLARNAIESIVTLGLPEGATPILAALEAAPELPQSGELIRALARLEAHEAVPKALSLMAAQPKLRGSWFDTLLQLSGYHQGLILEQGVLRVQNDPPRPLRDELLEALLRSLRELGESQLLMRLLPIAAQSPDAALDRHFEALSRHKDAPLREAALAALALRLREFAPEADQTVKPDKPTKAAAAKDKFINASQRRQILIDALRAALAHPEADSKFLAAEGLARAGNAEGVQVLLTAIDLLQNIHYRQRAVLALGELAHPRGLDPLLRLASQPEHALQESAIEAIGHLGQSEQAAAIFERLKSQLSAGTSGLRQRALSGLRWFGTPEAWHLIRAQAAECDDYQTRQHAIELLRYDIDPEAARDCLGRQLEIETGYGYVYALSGALLGLLGRESLEAAYLLLRSPNQYAVAGMAPDYLERLCRAGDPERLLASLPKIHDDASFEQVATALLRREPLPAAAAEALLPLGTARLAEVEASLSGEAPPGLGYHPRVAGVLLQILARAGQALAPARLEHLAALAWSSWCRLTAPAARDHAGADIPYPDEAWLALLARIVWYAGQSGGLSASFSILLTHEAPATLPLRLSLLQTLAGLYLPAAADKPAKAKAAKAAGQAAPAGLAAWVAALTRLADVGERELRPLAIALLQRIEPAALAGHLPDSLKEAPALLGEAATQQLLAQPQLLLQADAAALRGFGPEHVPALARLLSAQDLSEASGQAEALATVLIEILAQLGDPGAEAALDAFVAATAGAKKHSPAQALGRQAGRLRQRAQRRREAKAPQIATEWLEVLA